jgi:hypothetical protein
VFCEGVLPVLRRREMDVALPYASWDTVRMKWRPSLKGVHNCYEVCTRLRRTMKPRTRRRYRQVVIILEEAEPVGCREKQVIFTGGCPIFFLNRHRGGAPPLASQANFKSLHSSFYPTVSTTRPSKTDDPDTVLCLYPASLLCRASCSTVRCTLYGRNRPTQFSLACSAIAGPLFIPACTCNSAGYCSHDYQNGYDRSRLWTTHPREELNV